MFNKKYIIILLIMLLFTISSVSASDLSDDIITNTTYDEIGVYEDNVLSQQNSELENLKSNGGTFTQLKNKISFATDGSTLYLDEDYYSDNNNLNGIYISKSITIDGRGHVVDGLFKSRLFYISGANNVVLKNIIFQNGVSDGNGGAIYLNGVNSFSVVDCDFLNNSAYGYGGAIFGNYLGSSSIVDCKFICNYASTNDALTKWVMGEDFDIDDLGIDGSYTHNSASNGGAISLNNIDYSLIDSCIFNNNFCIGAGGDIHFYNAADSRLRNSRLFNSFAGYGGNIYAECSKIIFKNVNSSYSNTIQFGGAIGLRWSDITVDNCNFNDYWSTRGAGGAIYIFNGNAFVVNSSFIGGYSYYGGAIANVQGNLTVLSSEFIDNIGVYSGGSIYSNHGNLHIDGSFFKNSFSKQGSAIFCILSNSLSFTNNIFINATGGQFIISSIHTNKEIVESGNHFENVYHVTAEYTGFLDDEPFAVYSEVLNYVVSNDGTYLNTYEDGEDAEYSDLIYLHAIDSNHPNDSVIYGTYDTTFMPKFYFKRYYDLDDYYKQFECIYINVYSGSGLLENQLDKVENLTKSHYISMNFTINPAFDDWNDLIGFTGDYSPVSSISSSGSDLTFIPSYYDSRDYGYITPVKDQGYGGNCWAFAGLATLEACIKKATGITYDFSENNPKNLMAMDSITGLNKVADTGGIDSMMMAYLTSWLGPINEKTELYDIYTSISSVYNSIFHIQDIYFLPARQNSLDNDAFKKAIMDYGAIAVSLDLDDEDYHAVSLVGWNDNYNYYDSLGRYTKGAWIFKNSWGSDWEDGGFGYLSYSTPFLSDLYDFYHAYTFIFNKYDDIFYDTLLKNYQYDFSGVTDYICSEDTVYYKNKFICTENSEFDEVLVGFSTYFKYPTEYTASLYINGAFKFSQCGHSDAGYHTIPFDRIYNIKKGDEFIIMIENHNVGENYVPVCQVDETSIANVKPNTSFVSFDGKKWLDLYDLRRFNDFLFDSTKFDTSQVACIKAFTSWYLRVQEGISVNEFDNIGLNEKIRIDITLEKSLFQGDHTVVDIIEKSEGRLVTININGKDYYAKINNGKASLEISFDKGGLYKLSARYANDIFASNIVEFEFRVNKNNAFISANDLSIVYGGNELITLKDSKGNLISDEVVYFNVNGKSTPIKTNSLGQASMPINLVPNNYVATISFAGNDVYNSASKTVNLVVKKATPKISASKATFKVKTKTKSYKITLKDNKGKAMNKAKVKIKVNGKTYSATTNSKGQATFKITKLTKKGNHKATITFAGTKYYNKVTKTVTITVKK